jgi:cytidylate kinase
MKYRNIVICGDVGTGTTTLGKALAQKLGWQFLSLGEFFRKYHKDHRIPLWDKETLPDSFDKEIDNMFLEKVKSEDGFVYDTHYGGWFTKDMPDIFRILLVCDKETANKRIIDRDGELPSDLEKRRKGLRDKFKKLYSEENYEDTKWFDLVIDTTKTSIEETLNHTLSRFKQS